MTTDDTVPCTFSRVKEFSRRKQKVSNHNYLLAFYAKELPFKKQKASSWTVMPGLRKK